MRITTAGRLHCGRCSARGQRYWADRKSWSTAPSIAESTARMSSRIRSHTGRLMTAAELQDGQHAAWPHHARPLNHKVQTHSDEHSGAGGSAHSRSKDLPSGQALPHFMQPLTHQALHHTGNSSAHGAQGKGNRHRHDHVVLPRARHNAADRLSDVEHHIDNMHATRGLQGKNLRTGAQGMHWRET